MDPNQALTDIRELISELSMIDDDDPLDPDKVEELITIFSALDEWLTKKGFLPDAWSR